MAKNEVQFIVEVKKGWQTCAAFLQLLRFMGMHREKKVKITAKEAKRTRSLSQNAFYWGCVVPVIQDMFNEHGNDCDPETVHLYLKMHIGGFVETVLLPNGQKRFVPKSSTELNTMDWEVWMDKIRAFAAQWGYVIPFPNE